MPEDAKVAEQNTEKLKAAKRALAAGPLGVRFDARLPGVVVPQLFAKNPMLSLNFSPKFDPPDLDVDEKGLGQTLQFAAVHERCFVPWEAVWGMRAVTGEMLTFPDSLPVDIARQMATLAITLGPIVQEALAAHKAEAAGAQAPPAFWLGWCRRAETALTGREPPIVQERPGLALVK
jgi:stringent starvation protein B